MREATIEKQTIYFPPPESKWNHMGQRRARSKHLGGTGESKSTGAEDPGEPQQPLPALTEFLLSRKTGWNCVLLSVGVFPPLAFLSSLFSRIIANQKATVGNGPGTVRGGNRWQMAAWLLLEPAGGDCGEFLRNCFCNIRWRSQTVSSWKGFVLIKKKKGHTVG